MTAHRNSLNRILSNGGIFMIFLYGRYEHQYFRGANKYGGHGGVERSGETVALNNWAMLSDLDDLRSQKREGFEVTFDSRFGHFSRQIEKAYDGAGYKTEVWPSYGGDKSWESLAVNKFGDSVAGVKTITENDKTGYLIVVPPLPKLHEVVVDLVQDWFVLLSPALFPFHDGLKWVRKPEYEVPEIVDLQEQIKIETKEHEESVKLLNQKIVELVKENEDWYTLLNGTGDELVGAVMRLLREFGFEHVVDVDEEARENGTDGSLREDLRLEDKEPHVVVDIKGVGGVVEDSEATQAEKHALMRTLEND